MTRYGVDYSSGRPSPAALRAAGYTFACRYLAAADPKTNPQKALTKAEADGLRAGGIDLVSNWETTADRALAGRAAGVADAQAAARLHTACGGPADRPIYFSVDFDAAESQQPAINAYFQGVASVIGLARTGAYGGYWVIKRLFDVVLIRYGWQTYAWSGGHWDTRAQLRQVQNGITVAGADVDKNQAMADDFGQWGYATTEDDMDQTEVLKFATDNPKREVGQVLADLANLRNTLMTAPGKLSAAAHTAIPAGSVLDVILQAAQHPAAAPVALTDADRQAIAADIAAQLGGKLDALTAKLGEILVGLSQALDG